MYSLKYFFRVLINDQITTAIPVNDRITVSEAIITVIQHLLNQRLKLLKFYRIQNS